MKNKAKQKINQTTISIPLDNLNLLKRYSGELLYKTGIQHSVSDLIIDAVNEKYSSLLKFPKNEK